MKLSPNEALCEVDTTKDSIKTWLKRTGRDREWLGNQLRTEAKTVNNWLSTSRPIPEAKLALIQRLMADDIAEEARQKQLNEPTNQVFSVEVDLPRFRRYNAAAAAQRMTMEQWTIGTLDEAVDTISAAGGLVTDSVVKTPPPPNISHFYDSSSVNTQESKAAEDPRPYRTGTED